jgi:hypothetical protein
MTYLEYHGIKALDSEAALSIPYVEFTREEFWRY